MTKVFGGFDPAKRGGGLAIYCRGEITSVRYIEGTPRMVADELRRYTFDLLAVEVPRVYPGSPADPNDILDLSLMSGAALGSSRNAVSVYPQSWKGSIPKTVHHKRIKGWLTENSLNVVNACTYSISKRKTIDIWDAVGLAIWAAGRK